MLGRCQQALYRGVLAGLQQQQQCLQLEVCLGFQAVRGKKGVSKGKLAFKSVREQMRQDRAFNQALDRAKGGSPAEDLFAAAPASAAPAAAAAAAAAAAGTAAPATSAESGIISSSSSSSGPVSSPLSAQLPGGSSMSGVVSSSSLQAEEAAPAARSRQQKPRWSKWLNNLFERPKRQPPPGPTSPLQQAAPAWDGSSTAGDGWEDLDTLKDLSMDQYVSLIRNDPQAGEDPEAPPRPRVPPRGPQAFSQSQMDRQRVTHARYEQQSALITVMDQDVKLKVKQDPAGALRSPAFLAHIAQATSTDISVVRDTIWCYGYRKEFLDLLNEYRQSGRPMPQMSDNAGQQQLVEQLKAEKKQKEWDELRKNRDPENCEFRAFAKLVSPRAKCHRTSLLYSQCCGAPRQQRRA